MIKNVDVRYLNGLLENIIRNPVKPIKALIINNIKNESNNMIVELKNNIKSLVDSYSINLPDKLYKGEGKKEEIDEIRWENDTDSPFVIK